MPLNVKRFCLFGFTIIYCFNFSVRADISRCDA